MESKAKKLLAFSVSFAVVLTIVFFWFASTQAAIPKKLTIQGKLDQGGSLADGNYAMVFKIYDVETGGTALYTESHTASNKVAVNNGFFKTTLGDLTALDLAFDVPYWLGITIESDSEIAPRIALNSSSYAMKAGGLVMDANLNIDSGTLFVDISGDKVGIGTTSPEQKLSVAGTIESTSGGFKFPDATTQTTAASLGQYASNTCTGASCVATATCPSNYIVIWGYYYNISTSCSAKTIANTNTTDGWTFTNVPGGTSRSYTTNAASGCVKLYCIKYQ
ncbi:MAG: hypothetical protein V1493_05495 [Candidatus Diapherotrites archaeon]